MKKNNIASILISVILILLLGGAVFFLGKNKEQKPFETDLFAMDTIMSFTLYGGKDECEGATAELTGKIQNLESHLSATESYSEVYSLNEYKKLDNASDDMIYLLERAKEASELTDGLFDVTVYPLVELWGFPSDECHLPEDTEIHSKRNLIDYTKISINKPTKSISFEEKDMKITLGGIAKGYASDQAMQILWKNGVDGALLSLGGNIVAYGKKPDGSLWNVAVASPDGDGKILAVLSLTDMCVITSGGYERCFEENGKTYHHILDPRTGYPAESGLSSVTIVTGDGTLGDALSTALYVMGKENACDFWRRHSDEFDMILATDDGKIFVTEGIKDCFRSEESFEIIAK